MDGFHFYTYNGLVSAEVGHYLNAPENHPYSPCAAIWVDVSKKQVCFLETSFL